MRVLIGTDAWAPQVNGVVRTLKELQKHAPDTGLALEFITPERFRTFALPGYAEIRLAFSPEAGIAAALDAFAPDAAHIVTEGPIGAALRRLCLKRGLPFTTSYHTRFPEYLNARLPVPVGITYRWLKGFHNAGRGIMVATQTLHDELTARGFGPLMRWSRGVDLGLFNPDQARKAHAPPLDLPRPIFLSVGRVAVEKNLPAFLDLDLPGSKLVIGDGPALPALKARYPAVTFLGGKTGPELAALYASADVFVFPSLTDTFGLVLLEALASGLPVAAFPVMGPRDIITSGTVGALDTDLHAAALKALQCSKAACIAFAGRYSWRASAEQFATNMRDACHRHP